MNVYLEPDLVKPAREWADSRKQTLDQFVNSAVRLQVLPHTMPENEAADWGHYEPVGGNKDG